MKAQFHASCRRPLSVAIQALALATAAAGARAQGLALEEVIVTAQKRAQSVQDVGITVSTFTGETLQTMGITNSNQLATITPNLDIRSPSGEGGVAAIFIRGVGLNDFAVNNAGPVGYYVDDVYVGSSNAQVTTMYDVDRVEVLKGPQGTLFGRNTTGGAIQIISNRPTRETEGYARLSVGQWESTDKNSYDLEGAISGSLTDALRGRLAVTAQDSEGYMTDTTTGDEVKKKNQAARLLLEWDASDTLSFLFNLNGARAEPDSDLYGTTADSDFYANAASFIPELEMDQWGTSLHVNWELANGLSLTSITAYQELDKKQTEDADMNPLAMIHTYYKPDTELFSQEFRLAGETDRLNWIAGLYYLNEKNDFKVGLSGPDLLTGIYQVTPDMCVSDPGGLGCLYFTLFDGGFGDFDYDNHQELETVALFGQTEIELTEKYTLTVGGRYTDVSVDFRNSARLYQSASMYIQGAFGLDDSGLPWGTPDLDQNQDAYSGKLALNYYANDDIMVYGSVSRGFKSGGFNGNYYFNPEGYYSTAEQNLGLGLAPQSPDYDDETLTAYEIGLKSTWLEGAMTFNAAVFYYDYDDAQIFNQLTDPIVGLPSQSISNADKVEMSGFDADLVWLPLQGLTLRAGIGYLDSEFKQASLSDSVGNVAVLDGETPQNSPEWTGNLFALYEWGLGDGTLSVQTDVSYTDEVLFSNGGLVDDGQGGLVYDRNEELGEDSVTLWNARLAWRTASDGLELGAWGRNLTDKEYRTYMFELTDIIGADQVMRGMPRSYGVDLTYRF